jgi:hypothetical protein
VSRITVGGQPSYSCRRLSSPAAIFQRSLTSLLARARSSQWTAKFFHLHHFSSNPWRRLEARVCACVSPTARETCIKRRRFLVVRLPARAVLQACGGSSDPALPVLTWTRAGRAEAGPERARQPIGHLECFAFDPKRGDCGGSPIYRVAEGVTATLRDSDSAWHCKNTKPTVQKRQKDIDYAVFTKGLPSRRELSTAEGKTIRPSH